MSNGDESVEEKNSRYKEFCEKWNINSNLVMLKLTLFVLYGGKCKLLKNNS